MKTVLVPLAPGFEELEAVTVIDLLRRADIRVLAASLDGAPVTGSHGIEMVPDLGLEQALEQDLDMVVLPGGLPGADNLQADPRVTAVLRRLADSGKFTAAICAAPRVLAVAGVLDGKRATSYPGFLDTGSAPGIQVVADPVVRDGRVITSRGPGTAMDFALEIVEVLSGAQEKARIESGLQRPGQG